MPNQDLPKREDLVIEINGIYEPVRYDAMTGELDYGFMYHGITYADEAILEEDKHKMTVRFWKPVMKKGGIIEFIRPEDCIQKRHIREMKPKVFGTDNFTGLKEFTIEEVGE